MSLDWIFTDKSLHAAVFEHGTIGPMGERIPGPGIDEWLKPHAEAGVFATMYVGMPIITEASVRKFAIRVMAYETVHGSFRRNSSGAVYFTVKECLTLVGLRTNATRYTDAEFAKRLAQGAIANVTERADSEFEEAHRALKKAA